MVLRPVAAVWTDSGKCVRKSGTFFWTWQKYSGQNWIRSRNGWPNFIATTFSHSSTMSYGNVCLYSLSCSSHYYSAKVTKKNRAYQLFRNFFFSKASRLGVPILPIYESLFLLCHKSCWYFSPYSPSRAAVCAFPFSSLEMLSRCLPRRWRASHSG